MPESSPALDDLLKSRGHEGVLVDSSGFTIDHLKAREKMSRFQLSDSGLWLVKLVQAAVAAGAPQQRWEAKSVFEIISQDRESLGLC